MRSFSYIFILVLLFACQVKDDDVTEIAANGDQLLSIPMGFPPMEFPEDNGLTQARWKLGKRLFFEKRFSIDKSISCASCHQPDLAFSDNKAFSLGAYNRKGVRNSPSLANVGYHPVLLREGSVPTLEMQVLVPIQEHNEFNHNILEIVKDLQKDSTYVVMSIEAYNRDIDAFTITRALANFQRTLISGNSKYDQYAYQQIQSALDSDEKKGMDLFFSERTNCASCHGGFNFTNYSFENNGLDSVYKDIGRQRFTNEVDDEALFKVPSLRNVELTSPYMHDGRFVNLYEVIEHYNKGGKNHKHKSKLIKPLGLTAQEKESLLAFLNSLTDFDFINNSKWEKE